MTHRIMVLEDDESLRLVISKALSRAGFQVRATASPDTALARLAAREADALVADVVLGRENFLDRFEEARRLRPDVPIIIMSAQTTARTAFGATQTGVYEYLPKPFDLNRLVELLKKALDPKAPQMRRKEESSTGLIGESAAMQAAFRALGRLSQSQVPVLVLGPSGSGRGAAAREIHSGSNTQSDLKQLGPLALAQAGLAAFAERDSTSLLLRRCEEWDEKTQALVLEGLEADTQASPRIMVTGLPHADQVLRPDLWERLAIGLVRIPPVRERGSDRSALFARFLEEASDEACLLSEGARKRIDSEVWPGEVAQIQRVAHRLAAQGPKGSIAADDVSAFLEDSSRAGFDASLKSAGANFLVAALDSDTPKAADQAQLLLEAGLFEAALTYSNGVRLEAAKLLGMNRNTFARKLDILIDAGLVRLDGNSR